MSKQDQGHVVQSSARQNSRKQETAKHETPATQANTAAIVQRTLNGSALPTPGGILQLQRTIGNRAVGQVLSRQRAAIQAKLTVGAADDPYEREADRVASQVMSMSAGAPSGVTRTKRTFGKEDDAIAQRTHAVTPMAQRSSPDLSGSFDASHDVERQISSNRGGGNPLPAKLRSELEPRFGADFSNVRVHTGAQSDTLNRSIGAQAFTHSNHIYMASGKYNPGTGAGKHLLAHELTHVVQQSDGAVKRFPYKNKQNNLASDSMDKGVGIREMRGREEIDIRRKAPIEIQRWGEMKTLYKYGTWKYSGGSMATNTAMDPLWHASVFRVNQSGQSDNNGLFFNGFHLTMEYRKQQDRINPHVFFDAQGNYIEAETMKHGQTKAYIQEVGDPQWQFDLATATQKAPMVIPLLGPELQPLDMERMEQEEKEKRERQEGEEQQKAEIEAQKEKQRLASEAAAQDEDTSINALLTDVNFNYGPYPGRFINYIKAEKGERDGIKIDKQLKAVADWYVHMRDDIWWVVSETPKAAYTGWNKTPANVVWEKYDNCEEKTWRSKNPSTGLMSEFRMLKFNGYASYKLHPKALKPPKT
jgi:Domain of unknown function (DUF4157)